MHRIDYKLIEDLVPEGATVLDLACGDGELLSELIAERHVHGSGVEIDHTAVEKCIGRGLSVFHGDLDAGLADFSDQSHDVVILSLSLQQLRRPRMIVREMVRVGRLAIVSFPNFAHWVPRSQLLLGGRMPVSRDLPVPVVGHAQHPPLHHPGLPQAVPRRGAVHRARAVPDVGGQGPAAAAGGAQPVRAHRHLRRHALLSVDPARRDASSGVTRPPVFGSSDSRVHCLYALRLRDRRERQKERISSHHRAPA